MVQTPDSSIPSFVAELVRAANEIERVTPSEVRKLLFRAITTVSDLREQVGIPGSGTGHDAIVGLNAVADHIERQSNERMSAALLEAADLVRTLWIVLDSGVEITTIFRN
ncbi:hypothetical protein [Rhizobium anhuiense]|uniref:Uncharacterized protein n=1 Tax=Rhizobium anhuiense TaxID=1184720 RepID=A0A432NA41_9HYPH|nr:hypothetical protein [Rhizobium anhuiense]RUL96444.1 hypothetical protein EEQ99_30395 [Rhizobium anhuiense]GGE08010.1 hypothetical protein GCM10008012_58640 [Rhizobium anhuiense]